MTQINFTEVLASFSPLTIDSMIDQWSRLHAGDCEALPTDDSLKQAWLLFHNGQFEQAIVAAKNLAEPAMSLRLKALATQAHYCIDDDAKKVEQLQSVIKLAQATEYQNVFEVRYQEAYALGRYGQAISIAKALTEGLAGQVSSALSRVLELENKHADAHTAFATYQSEIIGKLGKIAAKLTYGATVDSAEQHYASGIELAPNSVSARTEYADGLITMYGRKQRKKAIELYQQAAQHQPIDVLEALDVWLAQYELKNA